MLISLSRSPARYRQAFGVHIAPLAPPADLFDDEIASNDMPILKGPSIEVQVTWQVSGVRLHRVVQQTPGHMNAPTKPATGDDDLSGEHWSSTESILGNSTVPW
jgi:hypothetical protein